jgi:GAF domain-containing protein
MTGTMPTEADQQRIIDALRRELEARTAELAEARAERAATAEILEVINSSPSDLAPVFEVILQKAHALCGIAHGSLQLCDGECLYAVAVQGVSEQFANVLRQRRPLAESPAAQTLLRGERYFQIDDASKSAFVAPRRSADVEGTRTILGVPLCRDGRLLGVIFTTRREVKPFTEKEISLLESFADQAVIAIENARLFNEVQAKTHDIEEALRYQTGSANILNVIASSPTDVRPVLKSIVESACELCEAYDAVVLLKEGDDLRFSAHHGPIPLSQEKLPINRNWVSGRAFVDKLPIHVHDLRSPEGDQFSLTRERLQQEGHRTVLSMPLLREGESIGAIVLRRTEVHPFTDKQIALLQTFADQAVIALGNVRLFEEVQAKTRDVEEALTYQTGSSNILRVIASSPTDVKPVLQAIVESACELCGAYDAVVILRDGQDLRLSAHHGPIPMHRQHWPNDRTSLSGRAMADRRPVHIHDILSDEGLDFAIAQEMSRIDGCRTLLSAPLLREGEAVGTIALRRFDVHPFSDKQVALLQTFADQAVIALGNARLFEEVQAKTRDLEEALTYQTGSSNILRVIASSPTDVKPVLQAIVESACELCGAYDALVRLKDGDGLAFGAHHGPLPVSLESVPFTANSTAGLAMIERKPVHVHDLHSADGDRFPHAQELARSHGERTILSVPLLREGESIGAIILRRTEVNPFTDKQITLLQTFADQAVIAIENVRLFDEVQARTRDLQESLQQQTATSEVLKVISSSPGELEPVFRSMLENAVEICDAKFGNLFLVDGDTARWEAGVGTPPKLAEFFTQSTWFRPTPGSHLARVLRTKQVSHTADDTAEAVIGVSARLGGARSTVCVPMVKDDTLVGAIFIYRTEVRPFTDKQIDLVKNFAAQAVIAIENARLLKELRQRTDDLSASLDDLRTAQDRLIQTEKLASLGQLTAGIAHEIKNPLNFVNNFAALSVELTDELNDVLKQASIADKVRAEVDELTGFLKDNLAKVVQHGKRADSIVKNMLLHSREGSGEHRPADINALVDESLNLAYHGARAEKPQFNVTLQRNFDPEAGMVDVFPQEITRVFLNLLSNGFYAVTKRKADNGAGFEPVVSAMTKGRIDGVEIRIRDNGTGIPPEVKEKMFNPFFTTKPAGEGTGLGLSMSYDIVVKQHGGTIDVDTLPGEFTEFTIVLPRTNISKKN